MSNIVHARRSILMEIGERGDVGWEESKRRWMYFICVPTL